MPSQSSVTPVAGASLGLDDHRPVVLQFEISMTSLLPFPVDFLPFSFDIVTSRLSTGTIDVLSECFATQPRLCRILALHLLSPSRTYPSSLVAVVEAEIDAANI